MLNRRIEPRIILEVENQRDVDGNLALDEHLLHFKQDGAPPHYVRPMRRRPTEWPPRSADLTPLDFFLWGHLKSVLFKTQPDSIEDLQQRIKLKKINNLIDGKHSKGEKRFECILCPFTTRYKCELKKHSLKHKSIDEVETFKCHQCSYITKHKSYLRKHEVVHKNIKEVKTFSCPICPYTTKRKSNLKIHAVSHKKLDEVETVKCSQCTFETKYKRYLKVHDKIHKNFDEVRTFDCPLSICSFKSRYKHGLKWHMLTHQSFTEVPTYHCQHCSFKTKYKSSLKKHCNHCTKHLLGLQQNKL